MTTIADKVRGYSIPDAHRALAAYRALPGHPEDNETVLTDLIADLLHLAESYSCDAGAVADRATNHWAYESANGSEDIGELAHRRA